jgi:hypothetical protein
VYRKFRNGRTSFEDRHGPGPPPDGLLPNRVIQALKENQYTSVREIGELRNRTVSTICHVLSNTGLVR